MNNKEKYYDLINKNNITKLSDNIHVKCEYSTGNHAQIIDLLIYDMDNKLYVFNLLNGRNFNKVIINEEKISSIISLQEEKIIKNYKLLFNFDTYRYNFGLLIKRIKDDKNYPNVYLFEYKKYSKYMFWDRKKFPNVNLRRNLNTVKYCNFISYKGLYIPHYSNVNKILNEFKGEKIIINEVEYKLYRNIPYNIIKNIKSNGYCKLKYITFIDNDGLKNKGYITETELKIKCK